MERVQVTFKGSPITNLIPCEIDTAEYGQMTFIRRRKGSHFFSTDTGILEITNSPELNKLKKGDKAIYKITY